MGCGNSLRVGSQQFEGVPRAGTFFEVRFVYLKESVSQTVTDAKRIVGRSYLSSACGVGTQSPCIIGLGNRAGGTRETTRVSLENTSA